MPDTTSSDPMLPPAVSTQRSRRNFLRGSAAAVAGVVTAGLAAETAHSFLSPHSVLAQSMLMPDAALKELMDGNGRFVSGKTTAHEHDLTILKQHLEEKQEPYAAVLSCADSRVPVEIVFDQTIGHLFVTRVAGNIITPEIIGSLEYGVAVLGTKVILVLGHSNCGGRGQVRAWTNQRALSAHPARRRRGWPRLQSRHQGECKNPGEVIEPGIHGGR